MFELTPQLLEPMDKSLVRKREIHSDHLQDMERGHLFPFLEDYLPKDTWKNYLLV